MPLVIAILKRLGLVVLAIVLWVAARLLIPAFGLGAVDLSPWYLVGLIAVVLLISWCFSLIRKAW